MKRILVLGAGQSSPYLVRHLLAAGSDIGVTVADRDLSLAQARVRGTERGEARPLDATDAAGVAEAVADADIVVNFLAPVFQAPVAKICLDAGRSMISASYRSEGLLALDAEAKEKGLVLASELGLDPGLDHLSAQRLLAEVRRHGDTVESFYSYGSGVVDRDSVPNPLGYAITWNPRNVVRAGADGARFREDGVTRLVPYPQVFRRTWPVEVPGEGPLEAYANRDSLPYLPLYALENASTVVRATLRHSGYCETWSAIVQLGLSAETVIPNLVEKTWRELVECTLPPGTGDLGQRVAALLRLHPSSRAIDNLRWLGLFEDRRIRDLSTVSEEVETAADAMIALLEARLALPEGGRDLVILHHVVGARSHRGELRRYTSTLVERGDTEVTAMARTVGLPAALATLAVLDGSFPVRGTPIPTDARIVERLLPAVEDEGLRFSEACQSLERETAFSR